ncbi:hypothetical protein BJY04DRAFT_217398 [Aspergillus karnatakaensis]|uniref:uncharacterized protein n=1 Tax=Aspergillus karnatakaensis TaxID=1810916 RepID=UPI003CCCF6C4
MSRARTLAKPPQPMSPRRFGRTYRELDAAVDTSLCYKEIGKVQVDCKLCVCQSQWGQLETSGSPVAIVYMDLTFHQPLNCRLASATVRITLDEAVTTIQEDQVNGNKAKVGVYLKNELRMTDYFGPKNITGEPISVTVTKTVHLTPQINVLGSGASGLGFDYAQAVNYNTRWSFTGRLQPGERIAGSRGTMYRALIWELCENELGGRPTHSNVIHTGFALEHTDSAFWMDIKIEGKLQSKRDRVRDAIRYLKFPSPHDRDQGTSSTLMCPDTTSSEPRKVLDMIVQGLPSDMEQRNFMRIPVHIPDSLPVSFTPAAGQDIVDSALPIGPLAEANAQPVFRSRPESLTAGIQKASLLTVLPESSVVADIEPRSTLKPYMSVLGSAVHSFHNDAQQSIQGEPLEQHVEQKPPFQPVQEDPPKQQPVSNDEITRDTTRALPSEQDPMELVAQYPTLVLILHSLARLLNLILPRKSPEPRSATSATVNSNLPNGQPDRSGKDEQS